MKKYEQIIVTVIELNESDCVRTSGEQYFENELPLVPFEDSFSD